MAENSLLKISVFSTFLLICGLVEPVSGQRSLYSDIKANEVGDVITVILRENISGRTESDARSASNEAGGAGGSVSGNFLPFEPTFGSDVQVNYGSDQRVQASQGQLLEGYMSVQITDVTPQGDFKIEGNRITEINGEVHEMSLEGRVRPTDINNRNQVYSYHIANANINYQKEGGVKELTKKRGLIRRIIFTGVGLGLGAAVIIRSFN